MPPTTRSKSKAPSTPKQHRNGTRAGQPPVCPGAPQRKGSMERVQPLAPILALGGARTPPRRFTPPASPPVPVEPWEGAPILHLPPVAQPDEEPTIVMGIEIVEADEVIDLPTVPSASCKLL